MKNENKKVDTRTLVTPVQLNSVRMQRERALIDTDDEFRCVVVGVN